MTANLPATALDAFAANVRRLRLRRQMTQAQLAERIGVQLRYMQALEAGRGNPPLPRVLLLADTLAVPVGALFRPAQLEPQPPGRPRKGRRIGTAKRRGGK